ncbi:DUF2887 domain-containing protein [Dolichospermum sp. LEGE 00246]|uniref:DUF2887 domain-containing protein n=1 Tax=Dolichospermum sp. LEGE 00246 TaxID=1828605 RepID=UPI00351C119E
MIGNSHQLAELYQFSSVEVKQTALRIDGVFLPNQNTDNPIYFLEVQFQSDKDLYHRLFSEIFLYIRQNKPKNQAMFGLSELKQTRFYQEAKEEGKEEGIEVGERKAKLDAVPGLIALGLTTEQIAQVLNLSLAEISEIIQQQNTKDR